MIKIDPNPTFKWDVKFNSPEGEQVLKLVFKHMSVEEHEAWWEAAIQRYVAYQQALQAHADAVAKAAKDGAAGNLPQPKIEKSGLDEVMELVAGWEDVDGEFSREAMGRMMSNYHDLTAKKICQAWSDGLTQRRRENS